MHSVLRKKHNAGDTLCVDDNTLFKANNKLLFPYILVEMRSQRMLNLSITTGRSVLGGCKYRILHETV